MIPYRQLLEKYSVDSGKVAYIGDDIVDLPLLHRAGFSIAVADAAEEAKGAAMMITKSTGGRGAVREISDFLLKAKGLWEGIIDEYSQA
jgi:3-deoxy-D-manno-octulosonate 8-phosphate phosphatase (KDO 8-P phosphatase)